MSLSLRPTLRPVVWSDVDIHGRPKRNERVRSRSPDSASHYGPGPSGLQPQPYDHLNLRPQPQAQPYDQRAYEYSPQTSYSYSPHASSSHSHSPGVQSRPHSQSHTHAQIQLQSQSNSLSHSPDPSSSNGTHPAAEHPRKKKKIEPTPSPPIAVLYHPPSLSPSEIFWRDRYPYLSQLGYQLRPRYSPNWSPMAGGNSRHYHSGEDFIMMVLPQVLDAIRRQDGLVVCLKSITDKRKLKQIAILEHFSRVRKLAGDPRNHVVPVYDAFGDIHNPGRGHGQGQGEPEGMQFVAMPVLRRFDDPPFGRAGEVVDFVSQILEGLVFMHENNVAHHNITPDHIMMNAQPLIPTGWHFVSHLSEPDGMTRIRALERKDHPVRYFYVGFGNCYHIAPNAVRRDGKSKGKGKDGIDESESCREAKISVAKGSGTPKASSSSPVARTRETNPDSTVNATATPGSPRVMDIGGNDDDVPELFIGKPYDPYKLDVYTLGNVLLKELHMKYSNLEFLPALTSYMRIPLFEKRPTAAQVLSRWNQIRHELDEDEMEDRVLIHRHQMEAAPGGREGELGRDRRYRDRDEHLRSEQQAQQQQQDQPRPHHHHHHHHRHHHHHHQREGGEAQIRNHVHHHHRRIMVHDEQRPIDRGNHLDGERDKERERSLRAAWEKEERVRLEIVNRDKVERDRIMLSPSWVQRPRPPSGVNDREGETERDGAERARMTLAPATWQ